MLGGTEYKQPAQIQSEPQTTHQQQQRQQPRHYSTDAKTGALMSSCLIVTMVYIEHLNKRGHIDAGSLTCQLRQVTLARSDDRQF